MKENKILCAIVAFFVLVLSSGCTNISFDNAPVKAEPNLTVENFQDVIKKTKTLSEEADKNLNQDLLKERFTGAALQMRTGQYGLAQKGYEDSKVENINFSSTIETVTKEKKWPRHAMYISQTEGNASPYMVLFTQEKANLNYKISNWVRLFANVSIPSTSGLKNGIELFNNADNTLVDKPEVVLEKYLSYLSGNKDLNHFFTLDSFAEKFWAENAKLTDSLRNIADVNFKTYTDDNEIVSFKLEDGSALVVTSFKYDLNFIRGGYKEKGKVSGALEKILGNDSEINRDIVSTYVVSIAFIVPNKKAKDKKIKPIGAERILVSVIKK